MPRRPNKPQAFVVGDLVALSAPRARLGQIREIFPYGDRTLHHVHYIDTATGKLMVCPDSRCKGEHTCPIHGTNEEASRFAMLPAKDIGFYQEEGMLDPSFIREAKNESRKNRRTPHSRHGDRRHGGASCA